MERVEREYMPLSGQELLEVIFRKGREAAAAYRLYFGAHRAFHNPKIDLAVRVTCYTPEGAQDEGGFELVIPLGGRITEPDRVREELGLGTLETKLVDEHSGTLADVRTGVKEPETNKQAVLDKVAKLLGPSDQPSTSVDPVAKPKPKRKKRRRRTKKAKEAKKAAE